MIGLFIAWLIAGILLVALSSLMYYNDTLGLLGFAVIVLMGVLILLISTSNFISWKKKMKISGKADSEGLKNVFILLIFISFLIFGFGAIGYLLKVLGIYQFSSQMVNTLVLFLIAGLFSTIGSILSWIYVERSTPVAISSAIAKQQHILDQLKSESEEIMTIMRSGGKETMESIESAMKIEEKNREELNER